MKNRSKKGIYFHERGMQLSQLGNIRYNISLIMRRAQCMNSLDNFLKAENGENWIVGYDGNSSFAKSAHEDLENPIPVVYFIAPLEAGLELAGCRFEKGIDWNKAMETTRRLSSSQQIPVWSSADFYKSSASDIIHTMYSNTISDIDAPIAFVERAIAKNKPYMCILPATEGVFDYIGWNVPELNGNIKHLN